MPSEPPELPATIPRPSSRLSRLAIMLGLAATATVQLVYWLRVDPRLGGDFPRYIFMARSFLELDFRHAVHYHYPPLYPLFLALFLPGAGSAETAARLAGVVITTLTVVPVFFLADQLFNRTVATLAVWVFAFAYFRYPFIADAQPLLNFFIYAGGAAGWASLRSKRPRTVFLTGIIFGLGTLAKMEAQAFFALFLAILAAHLIVTRFPWRRSLTLFALCIIGYLLAMSPYLGAYYHDTGRLSLNPKVASLFFGHNEPQWNRACYSLRSDQGGQYTLMQTVVADGDRQPFAISLTSYIRTNSRRLLAAYGERLDFTFRKILYSYLWFLLPGLPVLAALTILAGLVRPGWTRPQFFAEGYLWSFGLLTLLSVPLFMPEMRFYTPLTPVLVILAARGAEQVSLRLAALWRWRSRATLTPRSRLWILATLALLLAVPNLHLLATMRRETAYHQLTADRRVPAAWLKSQLEPGRKFLSMWYDVPFWYLAGLYPEQDVSIPEGSLPDILNYARQEDAEFIILEGTQEFAERYPNLVPLFNLKFSHPELTRVYVKKSPHGRYYLIYRIEPEFNLDDFIPAEP